MIASSELLTSRCCNHFLIIPSHYTCKMVSMYPGIKFESALQGEKLDSIKRVSPSSGQIKELWGVGR